MRLFFLLLLLANLAFFYLHEPVIEWMGVGEAPPAAGTRQPPAPPLLLLSERDARIADDVSGQRSPAVPSPEPDRAPAPPPPARTPAPASGLSAAPSPPAGSSPETAVQAGRCLAIGPYLEESRAADARGSAEEAGMTATLETAEREVPVGHWMLTKERYTLAEARAVMSEMNEKGIGDTALVSLDDGVAISLGVFSRTSALERRRRELAGHGYSPEVRPRLATRTVYMVRLEHPGAGGALDALLNVLAQSEPRLEWRETGCP